jgi:REP element-mobilizing transposase RayT
MEPGKFYHIYNHANGSENLFRSDENYRYFLSRYAHFINTVADTYVYCLMPNHIHFLARIKSEAELESTFRKFETFQKLEARISKQFANLFSSYTQAFNKMYKRRGSLFIPNFKRPEITDNTYLTSVIVYIHFNPVNHRFTNNLASWPWSSYRTILSDKTTSIKRDEVLKWFGNRDEFLKFHQNADEAQRNEQLSKSLKLLES